MINEDLLMELADCGTPQKLAKIIHKHISPAPDGSTDLEAIAKAVGITAITQEQSDKFEGLLVTTADKNAGVITINANSHSTKQRFTIAHELGHFLIPAHDKTVTCVAADLKTAASEKSRRKSEAEANDFASELLMPTDRLSKQIDSHIGPELEKIVALADQYKVSKEAMIRKYMPLTPHTCAVFFGKENKMFGLPIRTSLFPFISIDPNDVMPPHITEVLKDMAEGEFSEWFEVDPHYFLAQPQHTRGGALYAQILRQVRSFSTVLLSLEKD